MGQEACDPVSPWEPGGGPGQLWGLPEPDMGAPAPRVHRGLLSARRARAEGGLDCFCKALRTLVSAISPRLKATTGARPSPGSGSHRGGGCSFPSGLRLGVNFCRQTSQSCLYPTLPDALEDPQTHRQPQLHNGGGLTSDNTAARIDVRTMDLH